MEHIGEQAFWSGPHMLRSGVQAVSVALAHGGQLGGHVEGRGFLVVRGGELLHQYCTRRTRAEQDPAGEWGGFF